MRDVDALNAGYAGQLLEQYLENPSSVPPEWRALFERGDGDLATALPGLGKLLEGRNGGNGHVSAPAPADTDEALLNAVAAAASLVRATRTHGHRAARLDPLGTEPSGDPSLEPERLGRTPQLPPRGPAPLPRADRAGATIAGGPARPRANHHG